MNWIRGTVLALSALALCGATQLGAQSVESIMQARERLELTEQQLEGLETLRREIVERRISEMAEMTELRSQLQAGEIQRSDVMAALEDRRAGARARAETTRERIDELLTDDQRDALEQRRARSGRLRADQRRFNRPGIRGQRVGPRGPRAFRDFPGPPLGTRGFGPR